MYEKGLVFENFEKYIIVSMVRKISQKSAKITEQSS